MALEKFVVRLLDAQAVLLGWAEVYASPRPQDRGASCPYFAPADTAFQIDCDGIAVEYTVHWCDLDIARRRPLLTPTDVKVGHVISMHWTEPIWLVSGMQDVPLPATTSHGPVQLSVPVGYVMGQGTQMAAVATARASLAAATTNATSYATATGNYTPAANTISVAYIMIGGNTNPSSVTGHGVSYTQIQFVQISTTHRLMVYAAFMGASPTSAAVTVTYGVAQTGGGISEHEITGGPTTGTITQAFAQSPTNSGTATSGSLTFAAQADAGNCQLAGFVHAANEVTNPRTATGAWSESYDGNFNTPATGVEVQRNPAGNFDTTGSATWSSSSAWVGIGVEIRAIRDIPLGTFGFTGAAASLARTVAFTAAGVLALSGLAPAVTVGQSLSVPAGQLVFKGPQAPPAGTINFDSPGTLTLAGETPTVTLSTAIDVGVGALTFAGQAPALSIAIPPIPVAQAPLALTGLEPIVNRGLPISAGTLTLAGKIPLQQPGQRFSTHHAIQSGKVTGTLSSSFTAIIYVVDARYRTEADGGHVAHPLGYDLIPYQDAALSVPFKHTRILYASNGSNGQFMMWLRIPAATVGTRVYFGCGDPSIVTDQSTPSETWSSDVYDWVMNLPGVEDFVSNIDDPSPDESASNLDGDVVGTVISQTSNLSGGGKFQQETDEEADPPLISYVTTSSTKSSAYPKAFGAWVAPASFPGLLTNETRVITAVFHDSAMDGLALAFRRVSGPSDLLYAFAQDHAGNARTYQYAIPGGFDTIKKRVWVVFENATTARLYYHGSSVTVTTGGDSTETPEHDGKGFIGGLLYNTSSFFGGFWGTFGNVWHLKIDPGTSWIEADYNNQNSQSTFWGSGSTEVPIVNVQIGAGALTLAGQTPAIAGAGVNVAIAQGALAFTGYSPAPSLNVGGAGVLTLVGQAPRLALSTTPAQAALVVSGQTPALAYVQSASPDPAILNLVGYPSKLYEAVGIQQGTLTLAGYAPSLASIISAQPNVGALTLTGLAPTLNYRLTQAVAQGTLTFVGYAPSLSTNVGLPVANGALTLTGLSPTLTYRIAAAPAQATLTFVGYAPTAAAALSLTPAPATLTLTGLAPRLAQTVSVAQSVLTLTGYSIDLPGATQIATGVLSFTGYAPALRLQLSVSTAALTLAGQSVGLVSALNVASASLTLVGDAPALSTQNALNVAHAQLQLAGSASQLRSQLSAAQSQLQLSSYAPTISVSRSLDIAQSVLSFAGTQSALNAAVAAPSGPLALTGYAPSLSTQAGVPISAGILTLQSAAPQLRTQLAVATSELTLDGEALSFALELTIPCGTLTLTGQSVALLAVPETCIHFDGEYEPALSLVGEYQTTITAGIGNYQPTIDLDGNAQPTISASGEYRPTITIIGIWEECDI